jgi:phosphate transport system substrate-binding protein
VNLRLDRRSFIVAATAASTAAMAPAREDVITLVGYNDMKEMLTSLNAEFVKRYPAVRVNIDLPGTRFAPDALAAGRSTLAPMGARFTPEQLARFFTQTGTAPVGFAIAHASLNPKALSGPNGVFVHGENPLRAIDLGKLAKLFAESEPFYWRDLDIPGPLRDRPIVVTGLRPETPLALEFRDAVFPSCSFRRDYCGFGQSRDVIEFIGREPAALGFAALNRGSDSVHSLAIRRDARCAAVEPTPDTLRGGLYPLDRKLWIYARRDPSGRLSGLARTYLEFVLSKNGQAIIAAGSLGYLSLDEAERRRGLASLDD